MIACSLLANLILLILFVAYVTTTHRQRRAFTHELDAQRGEKALYLHTLMSEKED